MMLCKWEKLPDYMRTGEVRAYYDILRKKRVSLFFARVIDIAVSALLLIILLPLFLVLAVVIKLDSKGPVFYRQERATQYGRVFRIHKFRSMVTNADSGSKVTVCHDCRVTRVGRFIRRCRLDEVSQLIDVFFGDMTFVGTRPEVVGYVSCYTPEMYATLLLPAGVTSEASIYFKDEEKLLNGVSDVNKVYTEVILPQKMYYNLKSMKCFGIGYNIKVVAMTLLAVCGKEYGENIEIREKEEKRI